MDIDVCQHPAFDVSRLSTEDLEALIAIFERYQPDAAELAESGEITFDMGRPREGAHSRQR